MNDLLDVVLRDLAAEGDRLERIVADLDEAAWRTPTPAAGWDVAAQVAHLAWTDEVAVLAATDKEKWDEVVMLAIGDPDGFAGTAALAGAAADPGEILGRWRAARASLQETLRAFPAGRKIPWFGPPMSPTSMATARFMETWAHGLDVYDALFSTGSITERPEPTDRIRHIAHLGVRTRNFAFGVHGIEPPAEEFGVTLVSPSEDVWSWGPADAAQTVTGPAYDFCLLVTQRVHRDDTDLEATGEDANAWLDVAQAFAGPSGDGRAPRG